MVQFWAHQEVVFVHCCVLQFAYCAVVMAEDFDVMEVCCETIVTCVELEICDCLFSEFIFVVFPCSFNVLPLCLAGCSNGFLGEFFLCLLLYESLDCFKVKWCLFVLKCGSFFFLPVGQLFRCHSKLYCSVLHILDLVRCFKILVCITISNIFENDVKSDRGL